ncbi:DUF1015 domain-containing protein [Caproiciproducens faecalis]|uniref:DUF1015 domain-containing protein n=1 Tax=Caproiciproducens faecalis TaxID=2820301 RepID=A0ABS7DJP9_9FIRM|nr:DUF1015 domain-containing protein [Caproiciproducens faecalis]MBW7571527.1 DUF1015 domain-containing protein [Caproiciproducens faecalis]
MLHPYFKPADILLPKEVPTENWCVVACDQYTSQPEYWQEAKEAAGDFPSTYHMVYPECYLETTDAEQYAAGINAAMERYLSAGVFREVKNSYLYVERTLADGKIRHGVMMALDLEQYRYEAGSKTPIRATEGTVLERIPPRVKIRRGAPLELPHIMILIDDPERSVIEKINPSDLTLEYEGKLMQNSGSIRGFRLNSAAAKKLENALSVLPVRDNLLFAVGDGNHSLATAKACYEELKKTLPSQEAEVHPARWALVEVVNLYDESLQFEPIHRVIFQTNPEELMKELYRFYDVSDVPCEGHRITCLLGGKKKDIWVKNPPSNLEVGTLQKFLDARLVQVGGKMDYIHGVEVAEKLCAGDSDSMAFFLPKMEKSSLFETVAVDGALPRKTFSMGHACDKRFYMECRKIK